MKKYKAKKTLIFLLIIINIFINITPANAIGTATIDLTGLASGAEVNHDCSIYLETISDTTHHWKRCTICKNPYGEKSLHSFIDNGWTMGSANYCNESNVHKYSCSCGYSKTDIIGRKEHNWSGYSNELSICRGFVYSYCTNGCGNNNAGNVAISNKHNWTAQSHRHMDSAGNLIHSRHLGTCVYCNNTFTASNYGRDAHMYAETIIYNATEDCYYDYCACGFLRCKLRPGKAQMQSDGRIYVYTDIWLPAGESLTSATGYFYANRESYVTHNTSFTSLSGNWYRIHDYIKFNSHVEMTDFNWYAAVNTTSYYYNLSGGNFPYPVVYPEYTAPAITNVTYFDLATLNGWSTGKQFTFTGTENYCNTVRLTLKDEDGNIYLNNVSLSVTNNSWTYTGIPNIEASANGKDFTLIVKDTFGNTSEKTFTISKTDRKTPTMTSPTATSTEWSKSKNYKVTGSDAGIGTISIGFNNTNEYQSANYLAGNIYYRDYILTGDVYGSVTAAIYLKDGLGNTTTKYITISNIDNTEPTITNIKISSYIGTGTITITANDNKDFGGNIGIKSGSGIAGYAMTKTNVAPTTYQQSNVFTQTENGTYYIWIKDNAGNVKSQAYNVEIEAPHKNKIKHILTGINYTFINTTNEIYTSQEYVVNTSYAVLAPNGTVLRPTFTSDFSGTKSTYSFGSKFIQPAKVLNFEFYYDPVPYDIAYNLDGGTNNSSNPTTYTVIDNFKFQAPTKKGYDFFGWYLDPEFTKPITGINEGTNNNFTSAEDMYNKLKSRTTGAITVYAKFIIHDYKITTNIKSGVGVVSDISKVEYLTNTAVIITAGNGHKISKIEVDGTETNFNQGSQTLIKEFSEVEADHVVDVWFEAEDYWKNELDTYHKYEWMDLKFN